MRIIDADALPIEDLGNCRGVSEGNLDRAPTVDVLTAVGELYKRYQPKLATNVYEFGVELQELLGRYGGRE